MKAKFFMLFSLIIALHSCSKKDNGQNINGSYIGVFERNGNTSNVELTLNNGQYNGQSTKDRFPALCNGNYTISGSSITFTNNCMWTADFDWTLILNGEWNYTISNNTLTLIKSNGDKYTLTK